MNVKPETFSTELLFWSHCCSFLKLTNGFGFIIKQIISMVVSESMRFGICKLFNVNRIFFQLKKLSTDTIWSLLYLTWNKYIADLTTMHIKNWPSKICSLLENHRTHKNNLSHTSLLFSTIALVRCSVELGFSINFLVLNQD